MKWKIKNIEIQNQVVVAPMAGVSNPPYLKICEQMGASLAFSELISAEAIVRNNQKTFEMLKGIDMLNIPVGIQLFGSNPKTLAEAAKVVIAKYKVKLIDLNMGCPVPKVAIKNEAGSALLKNPLKVRKIVEAVVQAVDVPITVKIRSGWDDNHINAVEIAKICEEAGASAITIHARSRKQGYSGQANWQIIKQVKESVSIPVIGNGDITNFQKAKEMLDYTKCDAIMIGRALIGNPWLIKECVTFLEDNIILKPVSNQEKLALLLEHFNSLKKEKNEKQALLEIRVFALNYIKGMPRNKEIKSLICQATNTQEFIKIIEDYKQELKEAKN